MFFRKKKGAASSNAQAKGQFSSKLLRVLSSQFAIADEVLLRPEHIHGLEVKSIVVGLLVNKRVIYANEDITWDEATQTLSFFSRDEDKSLSHVEEFALLMPLEGVDERNMDYVRKEELSRVGLFKRGNTITAMSMQEGRRSYSIDGVVNHYLRLGQGLFANHEVAALSLNPDTFNVSERRSHQRLVTEVPATLRALKGERVFSGLLVDFVEEAGRFKIDDASALRLLAEGRPVSISIELKELQRNYRLEGRVAKLEEEGAVIHFRNIFKDGAYTPFSKLDGIEIKAMLQKLPQSHSG